MESPKQLRVVKEYSKADKEHAFEVYKDFQQGNRSMRKTSRLLDIPLQTIANWNKQFDWQRLIFEDDAREAELIRRTAEAKYVNELDRLIDHAIWLSYNAEPQHKVQADMVKYNLGVMRFSPVQKVEQDILDNRTKTTNAQIEAKEKAMTRDELIARINALAVAEELPEPAEFREISEKGE